MITIQRISGSLRAGFHDGLLLPARALAGEDVSPQFVMLRDLPRHDAADVVAGA